MDFWICLTWQDPLLISYSASRKAKIRYFICLYYTDNSELQVSDHIYCLMDLQISTLLLWRMTFDMYTPTYNANK